MIFRSSRATLLLFLGLTLLPSISFSEPNKTSSYKVLANQKTGLNGAAVQNYLNKGDSFVQNGDLDKAIDEFKKARKLSSLLVPYYRNLNGAFRALDARIPREMNKKGREVVALLAKANLRLASIHRRKNESDLAVPLLVEVVKLVGPTKIDGQKAYQSLLELGFADTPYAGGMKELK